MPIDLCHYRQTINSIAPGKNHKKCVSKNATIYALFTVTNQKKTVKKADSCILT